MLPLPSKANCLLAIAVTTGDLNLSPTIGAENVKTKHEISLLLKNYVKSYFHYENLHFTVKARPKCEIGDCVTS